MQELEMEDPVSEMEWSPYPGKKDDHTATATTAATTTTMLHGTGDNESEFDDEYDFDECDDDQDDECEPKFGALSSSNKRPAGGVLAFRRRRDQAAKRRLGGRRQTNKKANHTTCGHNDGGWLHQHDDDLGCCAMHSTDSGVVQGVEDRATSEARRLREVIEAMPQEAWLKVVGHLTDVRDVEMSVALVSHRFFEITRENLLWKKLAKKKWGPFLKWYITSPPPPYPYTAPCFYYMFTFPRYMLTWPYFLFCFFQIHALVGLERSDGRRVSIGASTTCSARCWTSLTRCGGSTRASRVPSPRRASCRPPRWSATRRSSSSAASRTRSPGSTRSTSWYYTTTAATTTTLSLRFAFGCPVVADCLLCSLFLSQDTNTMHFKEPTIRGEPVPPIARHTATVVGNRVFIIGGYGSTYFHDLSMLDMSTWTHPSLSLLSVRYTFPSVVLFSHLSRRAAAQAR